MLNARIRKRWRAGQFPIGVIGERADLTYPYDYLGAGPETLAEVAAGRSAFAETLKKAERPLIILGAGRARARRTARRLPRWPPRPRRPRRSSRTAGTASASCTPRPRASARSISASCRARAAMPRRAHGGRRRARRSVPARRRRDRCRRRAHSSSTSAPMAMRGAHRADVILPGAAYTEKSGIYVNTEGRVQTGRPRRFPPGDAREDWAILRALSDVLGQQLPYDSLAQLAQGAVRRASASARIDQIEPGDAADIAHARRDRRRARQDAVRRSPIDDFYLTNPIARASAVDGRMFGAGREPHHDGGGVGKWRNFWTLYLWPLIMIAAQTPVAARHPAGRDRLRPARRPQDLGGGADPARPERGRPVGPAAILRRPPQVRAQGAGDPGRRQQGRVPARAARDLRARALPPGR